MDPDTQIVTSQLRAALATSQLSQSAFARALGTSASRFSTYLTGTTRPSAQLFVRAQRLARGLEAARKRGLMTAPATASAVCEHLASGEADWAWRMLLQGRDHLRLMLSTDDDALLDSWEAAPSSTGSVEFDALLRALTRHEYEGSRRVAPGWTRTEPLREPWVPEHPFLTPARARAQTPDWLGALNIFVPARDLVTA